MRDIPIIFSAPMVLALLDGRKTMTRRLLYMERRGRGGILPETSRTLDGHPPPVRSQLLRIGNYWTLSPWANVKSGDRLWVREQFAAFIPFGEQSLYAEAWTAFDNGARRRVIGAATPPATARPDCPLKYRPSIHMPRWASRLTLTVQAVKIEPLQDISEDDAVAEGIVRIARDLRRHGRMDGYGLAGTAPEDASTTPAHAFERLWRGLHGAGAWASNPDVVALTFDVARANIDALPKTGAGP